MDILASCTLEESKAYKGKLVIPVEDRKKPDRVFLNIIVKGNEEVNKDFFSSLDSGKVKCVTLFGEEVAEVPEEWKGKVFNEVNLDIVKYESYPFKQLEDKGITTLVRLPNNFCDMRELSDLSREFEGIRFIGGNLLGIPGLNIGRFDEGKDKMLPVFDEIYDNFIEGNLSNIEGIQEIARKVKVKSESTSSSKSKKPKSEPKPNKAKKKSEVFNRFFCEEEDF